MVDNITSLDTVEKGQGYPLFWYEKNEFKEASLFDQETNDDIICRDAVSDWILKEVRSRFSGSKALTKEHIFYYVYGILHSKDYRERFASDLKKSLPRIPIVDDVDTFMAFYKAGRQLASLHLNYEKVEGYKGVTVQGDRDASAGYDYFKVEKLRFPAKDQKNIIIYNQSIRIEGIPDKVYEYVVNGKSALDWIMERYAVVVDAKSQIKNDPNKWAKEHNNPRYILDLVLSIISVSIQTVDIVDSLPKLNFD